MMVFSLVDCDVALPRGTFDTGCCPMSVSTAPPLCVVWMPVVSAGSPRAQSPRHGAQGSPRAAQGWLLLRKFACLASLRSTRISLLLPIQKLVSRSGCRVRRVVEWAGCVWVNVSPLLSHSLLQSEAWVRTGGILSEWSLPLVS
jgi:hypothetical protein